MRITAAYFREALNNPTPEFRAQGRNIRIAHKIRRSKGPPIKPGHPTTPRSINFRITSGNGLFRADLSND